MITDINSEDRLVQQTFAEYLHDALGWDSVYAWNQETFGPYGTLGRDSERDVVLVRDLRAALARLKPCRSRPVSRPSRSSPVWIFPGRWCSTIASTTATSERVYQWSGVTPEARHATLVRR